MGIRVLVTGPSVLNSFTMERAGAGAVASAIPPNTKARYTEMPFMENSTANTAETRIKVPSDWVSVVIIIALPDFRIRLHTSSVPIIRPTAHSSTWMVFWYHRASRIPLSISLRPWGPTSMPASSQPRIEGSFSLETSFPVSNAAATASMIFISEAIILFHLFLPFHKAYNPKIRKALSHAPSRYL